jgi:hypothetical protein
LESVLHGAQLVVWQMADSFSENTRIDGSDHLAKDLRRLVWECHLWMKAGGKGRARRRADDDGREREEIVGLHDHRIAASLLYVTGLARKPDLMDVTTDHAASP